MIDRDLIHVNDLKCPACQEETFFKYRQTSGESAIRCMNDDCTLGAHKITAKVIEVDYKDPRKEHFEFKNSIEKYEFYVQLMDIL